MLFQRGRYVALADYCAVGNSEVNMRDGDIVELLKVGCAGWWYVKVIGNKRVNYVENERFPNVCFSLCFLLQEVQWKVGHRHHI